MKIYDFVKKLLPRLERSAISEDLRFTAKELDQIATPAYEAANQHFKMSPLKSDEVRSLQVLFDRNYQAFAGQRNNSGKSSNFLVDLTKRLDNLKKNVAYIRGILDTVVDEDIVRDGLTLRAAYIIRAAANMNMVSRYMLTLLSYIYLRESMARSQVIEEAIELTPIEIRYVENNFERFIRLYGQYSENPEYFEKRVSSLPEAYVNKSTEAYLKGMTEIQDPMDQMGVSGFIGAAIYAIRLPIAQWQNSRYEAAKARHQQLQLRLIHLEALEKDKKDPVVLKEISILQDRIDKLEAKIQQTDDELGI